MITANGKQVILEGQRYVIMNDLANIIASCIETPEIDDDCILEAIKAGIKAGIKRRYLSCNYRASWCE